MGNYKNKNNKSKKGGVIFDQTKHVTKALNKHGQMNLKKKSKQERRELIAECMHHIEKNGKVKMRVIDNLDDTITCRLCGARIPIAGATKKDMKATCSKVADQLNFTQFIMQSAGVGDQKTADFLSKLKYELDRAPKILTRVQKTYMKKTQTKKQKKNRGYESKSGSKYGQWGER